MDWELVCTSGFPPWEEVNKVLNEDGKLLSLLDLVVASGKYHIAEYLDLFYSKKTQEQKVIITGKDGSLFCKKTLPFLLAFVGFSEHALPKCELEFQKPKHIPNLLISDPVPKLSSTCPEKKSWNGFHNPSELWYPPLQQAVSFRRFLFLVWKHFGSVPETENRSSFRFQEIPEDYEQVSNHLPPLPTLAKTVRFFQDKCLLRRETHLGISRDLIMKYKDQVLRLTSCLTANKKLLVEKNDSSFPWPEVFGEQKANPEDYLEDFQILFPTFSKIFEWLNAKMRSLAYSRWKIATPDPEQDEKVFQKLRSFNVSLASVSNWETPISIPEVDRRIEKDNIDDYFEALFAAF